MQRWRPSTSIPVVHLGKPLDVSNQKPAPQGKVPNKHIGFFHRNTGGVFQSAVCTGTLGMVDNQ